MPLNHWVYDFLDRMQTKGILQPQYGAYPYIRTEVANSLSRIQNKITADHLTKAELDRFEQLKGEFVDDLKDADVEIQSGYHERHLLSWSESDNIQADADLLFNQKISKLTGDQKKTISHTTGGGFLRGKITDRFGFFLYTYSKLRKGEDIEEEQFDPSQGAPITISGKNAFSDDASAYFIFNLAHLNIEFGRDEAQWGPGKNGNLMLSKHEAYFDMLRLQFQFKRFQFTSIHGKLNYTQSPKFLAAHRLELRVFPWLSIAGSELVIYGNRDIEPMYLNPLMPYHVAEHHLGDLDNNTMAFDATIFPVKNHKLYMEIFLDDFTTSENPFTYYGNKWALLCGWRWIDPLGFKGWDLHIEYARVEPYVYTHNDSINVYQEYGRSIGHWLGPNSDDLHIKLGYLANRDMNSTFYIKRTRRGEGNINVPPDVSKGTRKAFLSGTVESQWRFGGELEVQLFKDCFINADYSYNQVSNYLRQKDKDQNYHQIYLSFQLNY
ncbi:capsule assembly Wzi family protein [bacterium]